MSDLVYKNYLLTSKEFMVLSACVGMNKLHILLENKPEEITRKELNLIIFQLYQKGILYWKNEDFYDLKPEIRAMFRDMKHSKKELQVYSEKRGSPLLCFWNEYMVVTELCENEKDTIRIHSQQSNDFIRELCERGIFPERDSQEFGTVNKENSMVLENFYKDSSKFMREGEIQYESLQELLSESNELSAFITINDSRSGMDQSVILILDYGMFDCIALIENDSIQIDYYTVENLKRLLML